MKSFNILKFRNLLYLRYYIFFPVYLRYYIPFPVYLGAGARILWLGEVKRSSPCFVNLSVQR